MELDSENTLHGLFITMIVCIVSGVLYYMFRNTLFTSRVSVSSDSENNRKKKRNEGKKCKKAKKRKTSVDIQQTGDIETDKTQTSDDTNGEEDEHLSDMAASDHSSSCSEGSIERPIQVGKREGENFGKGSSELTDPITPKIEQSYIESINFHFSQTSKNKSHSDDSDSITSPGSSKHDATTAILSSVSESKDSLIKSKKSKRRSAKRSVRCGNLSKETVTSVESTNMEHFSESLKMSEIDSAESHVVNKKQESSSDPISASELRTTIKELEGQLKISEAKLAGTSQWANSLAEENKHFRTKEDETSLSLNVLQIQYNELLRTNKTLEHQKNLLNAKLKNTETENCDLLKRLDQMNTDALQVKMEAELELCKLREQLAKHEAQLSAMATAISVSSPSIPIDPIPELVRTQEFAQAMSNDNCLLKSRVEQLDSEVTQLHQTNMRQQQDLQILRVENHKLHTEKETALEELRAKRQVENDAVHMELNRLCHELEMEKQKNQELSISLSETRAELSQSLQQGKRQSEIIGSLEYQFAELNAQKQCLLDNANQSKIAYEAASSELRAQVANLSNDLMRVTNELNSTEQKVYDLTCQLESTTKSLNNNSDLNGEPIIINIKSDEVCINKQDENEELHGKIEDLLNRLSEVETNFNVVEKERVTYYDLYQAAVNEINYYKSTLIQTEDVLAKLEESAKQTESKWRQLLSESEFEQIRLREQLLESQSMLKDITGKLNKTNEVRILKPSIAEKKQKKSKARKTISLSFDGFIVYESSNRIE
ncbi:CTCL tumor antigen HD-CL-01/L14-2 [Schistosoma japonicum]|nr:CTCL tumor antigen HD-CL-01/L14-2 [Schistosoma japonicum]